MCYLCLEFLISMACVVMLWRVCVSYFSFSLFGLLRHVVSSTLSCSPIPVDSGWIIEWCWGRVISYTAAVITCRTTCVCAHVACARKWLLLLQGWGSRHMLFKEPDMLCEPVCFCIVCLQATRGLMHNLFCSLTNQAWQETSWHFCLHLRAGVLCKSFSCCYNQIHLSEILFTSKVFLRYLYAYLYTCCTVIHSRMQDVYLF